jgi:hypothetical protein
MKFYAVLSVLVLLTGCGGGPEPETDPAINIPAGEIIDGIRTPDLTAGIDRANEEVCRVNMQTAAGCVVLYQAQSGLLPATLTEAGVSAVCPDAGQYRYTPNGSNWKLECPATPSHGFVENSDPSW